MKVAFLIFIFNFSTFALFAQYNRISVKIIKNDGSELDCEISTFESKIVSNFDFKVWVEGNKQRIERSDIKQIITEKTKYEPIEYILETRYGTQTTTKKIKRLAELKVDGEVKLYAAYHVGNNSMGSTLGASILVTTYFLSRSETSPIHRVGFKGKIKEYFPHCKELLSKIKSKELQHFQISEIVQLGNNCH